MRALEARYRSIDHLDGYVEALVPNATGSQTFGVNLVAQADEGRIPALVKATRAAGTWQVPTEILLVSWLNDEDPQAMAKWPEMKVRSARTAGEVDRAEAGVCREVSAGDRQKLLALRRKIIKALHDGGVPFALGSDAPQTWNVPGFSAHRELGAIVAAGLTPYEALKSGTVNVGVYFGTQSTVGTVATGKRADLILLDANPLTNIANSSRIAGVMVNGRWLSKADIDARLASGRMTSLHPARHRTSAIHIRVRSSCLPRVTRVTRRRRNDRRTIEILDPRCQLK